MKTKWKKLHLIVATLSAVCLLPAALTLAQGNGNGSGGGGSGAEYTIIPFAPPDVVSERSYVAHVNDSGQAVGSAERLNDGVSLAVHYDIDGEEYTLLAGGSYAEEVNNLNQTVGSFCDPNGLATALFWSNPSATPVVIPPLDGHNHSFCTAINDAGVIVGYSYNSTPGGLLGRGFVCRAAIGSNGDVSVSPPLPLPPLPGDIGSGGVDISNFVGGTAWIAGDSMAGGEGGDSAVKWQIDIDGNGTLTVAAEPEFVGTLELSEPSWSNSWAINDQLDVCGSSDLQPFLALAGGPIQALPLTRDSYRGRARGLNDFGEVVGELNILLKQYRNYHPPNPHAALWKDGEAILLEKRIGKSSGWGSLWTACTINHAGVIGGRGVFDVNSRGFLMFPNQ
jgi:hypothetical protein